MPEYPETPENGKTGNRQIPDTHAGFAGSPLGEPATGRRDCSNPQKIARLKRAQHLVEALRRCGWVLQADSDSTWLECHRPLGRMARAEWQELAPEVHAVLLAEQGGPRPYPHR